MRGMRLTDGPSLPAARTARVGGSPGPRLSLRAERVVGGGGKQSGPGAHNSDTAFGGQVAAPDPQLCRSPAVGPQASCFTSR